MSTVDAGVPSTVPSESSMSDVRHALDDLLLRLPRMPVEADPEWASPCVPTGAEGMVEWRPIRQDSPWDLAPVQAALQGPVPAALHALFGSWWSATLETHIDGEPVVLPLPWNATERDGLTSALTNEATKKRAEDHAMTLFVANTYDDRTWVIDTHDGSVWLEEVGRAPERRVCDSLAEFLNRLG